MTADNDRQTCAGSLPVEGWNLFLDSELKALPWPWPNLTFAELTGQDVEPLPSATANFLRYSPTDGTTDRVHVPLLPREAPVCHTAMTVFYDAQWLYFFILAEKPGTPIPELADCANEDFAVVLPSRCPGRGFYFGMSQAGEHIGCSQVWDREFPFEERVGGDSGKETIIGPSGFPSQPLVDLYDARVMPGTNGLIAGFQISRELAAVGMIDHGRARFSAGRTCYATGEWVSWGSPIMWTARDDAHGQACLVEAMPSARATTLTRLDMLYDPESEHAVFEGHWQGVDQQSLSPFLQGRAAEFAGKAAVALNLSEQTVPLDEITRVKFAVPDGWNRFEVMTAPNPVRQISFEKVSGHVLQPSAAIATAEMPDLEDLQAAFARWHAAHEQTCLGDGGAFTNGSVGEGLAMAARLMGEAAWLDASQRAADYSWYRWENNQNYAAFALWHLAALHELEPDAGWLNAALYLARNFVIRDIGPGGAQGGHNFFTGYANITLKGMARLLIVLPADHPFRPLLRNKTLRFANQILARQQPNGMFAARNRKFLGYQHPVPGLFFVAKAIPEQTGHILPALAAMTHAVIKAGGSDPDSGLVLALASQMI